ncbi:hypothetical protein [Muricoccus vinaceus]|uniref:ABC transporter permease n=1 Tax=Muricoccus vinaceus TaxID=424704 RepID=A0ABV6IKV0_9PROT
MTAPGRAPLDARRSRLPWPVCAVLVFAASFLLWWLLAQFLVWIVG